MSSLNLSKLKLAATGSTGSIGTFLPNTCAALTTRLEASADEMLRELLTLAEVPELVIHLAAMTNPADCLENPDLAKEYNVLAARRWYEACERAGVKRFVFVSTSHVYKKSLPDQPIDISDPLEPKNLYGELKLQAEIALKEDQENYSCKLQIARVFSVLSPLLRPGFLLTGLHRRAKANDFSPIPGLNNIRDFLCADEVAEKLVQLASSPHPIPLANICSGKGKTVRSVAEEVFLEYNLDPSLLVEDTNANGGDPYIVGIPTETSQ